MTKTIGQRIQKILEKEGLLNRNVDPNYAWEIIDAFLATGIEKCNECHKPADYYAQQCPQDPVSYRCEKHLNMPPEWECDLKPSDFKPLWTKSENSAYEICEDGTYDLFERK